MRGIELHLVHRQTILVGVLLCNSFSSSLNCCLKIYNVLNCILLYLGITIASAFVTLPWKKHMINLVDTPGHIDFTMEVEQSLKVIDSAVIILDASAGTIFCCVPLQCILVSSTMYRSIILLATGILSSNSSLSQYYIVYYTILYCTDLLLPCNDE